MRILQVTALVAGGVGGHVRMLARGLSQAGHHVLVACPPAVAEQFGLVATGAAVAPVAVGSSARPDRDLRAVRELRRLAAGADVVHAHGVRAGALAALALRRTTTRLVLTTHNDPPGGAAGLVYAVLERLACRRADLVLGVSPDLVHRARRCGVADTGLAVVPADLARVPGQADRPVVRDRVRRELGLAADRAVVLSVGRLGGQKRMGAVVAAVQELSRSTPGALTLLVAGEGPDRAELAEQAAAGPADIRLLGHRADVPDLLATADVVVSAARWEGQPLWLQEALAVGAPILATDVGGTSLVVGEAAVLVPGAPTGLVARLATALTDLLADPRRRSGLSAAALARAGRLPTADDAVRAVLTAYRTAEPSPGEPGGGPGRAVN